MEKLSETLNQAGVLMPEAAGEAGGDYVDGDGILICGRCGAPKQMRCPRPDVVGGGSNLVAIPCECMRREEEERRARKRDMERRAILDMRRDECFPASGFYCDCTFDRDDGRTPETSSICERYAATFNPGDPYGLLLTGDVGTGKSYMSSAIANRVIDLGFTAFQTDVRYIVNLMESSFEKRQRNLDRVLSYDLLLIEDLGAQRNTSYMMEHVYSIIDGRYKSGRPMVITTNLSPSRMNDPGDEAWRRIFDRILERCYPVEFTGENRRASKKAEMRSAMRKRLGL